MKVKIEKEISYNKENSRWCCGIYCPEYSVWTGGYFGNTRTEAEKKAMARIIDMIKSKKALTDSNKDMIKEVEEIEI